MEQQIYDLIPKVMADVGAIEKARRNDQQKYFFRGIDDVLAAFQPVLAKHRVFYIPEVLGTPVITERTTKSGGTLIYTSLQIAYTFYAPDGSSVRSVVVGEAMDSGDKSSNKAMSAALKYCLLQVFCVPTEENEDADAQSHEVRPAAKPTTDHQPPTTNHQPLTTNGKPRHSAPAATNGVASAPNEEQQINAALLEYCRQQKGDKNGAHERFFEAVYASKPLAARKAEAVKLKLFKLPPVPSSPERDAMLADIEDLLITLRENFGRTDNQISAEIARQCEGECEFEKFDAETLAKLKDGLSLWITKIRKS
jgi:hypothetical protein